ncbi:MAG: hypothetical protein IJC91_01615 [Oscillospiraceae bacterium]|nr:hypothetical protein [Oscillospiraceae bacterium]
MSESLRKYIVTTSSDIRASEALGFPCVHLTYRINGSGILQRVPTILSPRKNLMGIFDDNGLQNSDIDRLVKDISNELTRRNYNGVLLDIQAERGTHAQIEKLCSMLSQRKIIHYLPIEMAPLSQTAKLVIPSTVSGGSLSEMLSAYTDKYGAGRLCMEIVRGRNDFEMPSYKPEGTMLSKDGFEEILKNHDPMTFFSSHLGCKYFTYRSDEHTHFVLFDDTDTAVYKSKLAESFGFYAVFIMYAEWGEHIKKIMSSI